MAIITPYDDKKNMESRPDIEAEVIRERFNDITAKYMKYIIKHNIDVKKESENPIVLNFKEAYRIMDSTYSFSTYEEIDEAEKKLDELWKYYNELS